MSSPQPVSSSDRIASIDALRGVALCGILLINIIQMGGPFLMDRPLTPPSSGDSDWIVWAVSQLFITGTMRGLFSLLFGVGLMMFMGDGHDSVDRTRLYGRRLMFLLLFGVIDSTLLLWPGDILVTYALAGFFVLPLQLVAPRRQLMVAAVLLVLVSTWNADLLHGLDPAKTVYSTAQFSREGMARLGDYLQNLFYMSHLSWSLTVTPLTFMWVGDSATMMLVGMALYRFGLFAADASVRTLQRIALIGYAVGLALRLAHLLLIWGNDGGPDLVSALIDQPGRLAMTLGHFALFQLLWRRFGAARLKAGFAAMGRMALTLYLGQSAIAALIFSGFGIGLWNGMSWPELWLVALAILAAQALFAVLWFRSFRYGPFEWLWRWGTYGRRP